MVRALAIAIAALAAASLGAASPAGGARAATCSASTVTAPLKPQALPKPVASMRASIYRAASRCDYAALVRLAELHGKGLEFSFGAERSAARYWRIQEQRGEPVMRYLVKLLNLPFARSQGFYVWPSAFRVHPTEADWRALVALYPQKVIDQMRKSGIGYAGYRVGVRPNGDWQFFVTGD